MSFGLRKAVQTFQRFIDKVVRNHDFCFAHIDDILVFYKNLAEYVEHLRIVFGRLHEYGVIVNPEKCVLGVEDIEYIDINRPS